MVLLLLPSFSLFLFLFFPPFASSFSLLYSFVRSFEFYFPLDNCVRTFVCILPSGVQMRMALCLACLLACRSFDTFTFCIKCEWLYCLETTLDDVVCSMFNVQGGWRSPLVIALLLPYLYSSNNKIICFFFFSSFSIYLNSISSIFSPIKTEEKNKRQKKRPHTVEIPFWHISIFQLYSRDIYIV